MTELNRVASGGAREDAPRDCSLAVAIARGNLFTNAPGGLCRFGGGEAMAPALPCRLRAEAQIEVRLDMAPAPIMKAGSDPDVAGNAAGHLFTAYLGGYAAINGAFQDSFRNLSEFLPSERLSGARLDIEAAQALITQSYARATAVYLPGLSAHARLRSSEPTIFGTGTAPWI